MATSMTDGNRSVAAFVDEKPCTTFAVGPSMDLDGIAKDWARAILDHSTGLTPKQRNRLRDIARPDRMYFSRSALSVLMELAAFATPSAATWGAEAIRGAIIGRLDIEVPTWSDAFADEERANHLANVDQMRWAERRLRPDAEAACESLLVQEIASRVARDSLWKHMATNTRSIVVARR
jgi:hypothetical protein